MSFFIIHSLDLFIFYHFLVQNVLFSRYKVYFYEKKKIHEKIQFIEIF